MLPVRHTRFYTRTVERRFFLLLFVFFKCENKRDLLTDFIILFQIIDVCNSEVGKMKQMEELIHISKTLEFDKLKVTAVLTFVFSLCDLFYFEES